MALLKLNIHMEEKELTEILNKEETKKGLVEVFYDSLKKLFSSFKSGNDADAAVIAQGQSDEEIETYKELCEDIHSFHQNLRQLQIEKKNNPELTEAEWLEKKLGENVDEVVMSLEGRKMSESERLILKQEQEKALDNEIMLEAKALQNESEIQADELFNNRKEDVL